MYFFCFQYRVDRSVPLATIGLLVTTVVKGFIDRADFIALFPFF